MCIDFFAERDVRYSKWKMAVERSLGWHQEKTKKMPGTEPKL
jgi:hypothetical protein